MLRNLLTVSHGIGWFPAFHVEAQQVHGTRRWRPNEVMSLAVFNQRKQLKFRCSELPLKCLGPVEIYLERGSPFWRKTRGLMVHVPIACPLYMSLPSINQPTKAVKGNDQHPGPLTRLQTGT